MIVVWIKEKNGGIFKIIIPCAVLDMARSYL